MTENTEIRRVRLTISSSHAVAEPEKMGKFASLFGDYEDDYDDEGIDPEDYPDEMNDALCEIMAQNGELDEDDDGDEDFFSLEELIKKCEEFADMIKMEEDDDNTYEFCTVATMARRDGKLEIEYREDDSMDDTTTVIVYDPAMPESVSIMHSGSVMSSLVCERGRRHISVYNTPIMPLEVAVYTKTCKGGFTFENGGELELDYIVELRGMDVQRTVMKIKAAVM